MMGPGRGGGGARDPPLGEHLRPEAAHQMGRNADHITPLPPAGWTVKGADRFPIVAGRSQGGQEYPACSIDIETGIIAQPPSHISGIAVDHRRDAGRPPAIDLERPQIVRSVVVAIGW